jgi:hypothetical protein
MALTFPNQAILEGAKPRDTNPTDQSVGRVLQTGLLEEAKRDTPLRDKVSDW